MSPKMKIMVCGHGRHGKDTFCEILQEYGYAFNSSSAVAAEFIFEELKHKYGYKTIEECWNDRINHRKEWFDMICDYNIDDPTALTRKVFETSQVYSGIRNPVEFWKGKEDGVFDLSIWIDACERLSPESPDSNGIKKEMCDIVIYNNGTEEEFRERVHKFLNLININDSSRTKGVSH